VRSEGEGLGCTFTVDLPVYFHPSPSSSNRNSRVLERRSMFHSRPPPPLLYSDEMKNDDILLITKRDAEPDSSKSNSRPDASSDARLCSNFPDQSSHSHRHDALEDIRNSVRVGSSRDPVNSEVPIRLMSHHRSSSSSVKAFVSPIASPISVSRGSLVDCMTFNDREKEGEVFQSELSLFPASVGMNGESRVDAAESPFSPKRKQSGNVPTKFSTHTPSAAGDVRALVVDDSRLNRRMMCRSLKGRCQSTAEASDGREAVTKVETALLVGQPYNAVLMDYDMPNLNGPGAARQLRLNGYVGLIIGITGMTDPSDVEEFLTAGADFVLSKPVNEDELDRILSGESSPYPVEFLMPGLFFWNCSMFPLGFVEWKR